MRRTIQCTGERRHILPAHQPSMNKSHPRDILFIVYSTFTTFRSHLCRFGMFGMVTFFCLIFRYSWKIRYYTPYMLEEILFFPLHISIYSNFIHALFHVLALLENICGCANRSDALFSYSQMHSQCRLWITRVDLWLKNGCAA